MTGEEWVNAERRAALIEAARRITAEAGPDCAPLMAPELALEIIVAASADTTREIERRTADGIDSVEDLVEALLDAVLVAGRPWRDALLLVGSTLERMTDYEQWWSMVGSWVGAVERALARAQARGLVHDDVDPALTALVLRDALVATARSEIRFEFREARDATARFMVAALRPPAASRGGRGSG